MWIGPTAACYGDDDDPSERFLVFLDPGDGRVLRRVSLDREIVEAVNVKTGDRRVDPFPASERAALLSERAEQVARIVTFFGLPAEFARV